MTAMSVGVLTQLARPSTDGDRRRARLVLTGVAGAGGFLLAALSILTVTGDSEGDGGRLPPGDLAPYIAQAGLRTGTAFGTALLIIPFLLFTSQALRTGTAARERRLAALSLAGATRGQLRRLAFLEGTRAAALGALFTGPVYLALWVIAGVVPPPGRRMLPDPTVTVLVGWAVLLVALTVGGGVAAALAARPARVSPLGVTRRAVRDVGARRGVLPLIALAVVFGVCYGVIGGIQGELFPLVMFASLLVLTFTAGPWLVRAAGLAAVRGGLVWTMAGRRLLADVRTPGRVAGVLFAIGVAFGTVSGQVMSLWIDQRNGVEYGSSYAFYIGGELLAAAGGAVACVVATFSLMVGATEQVLDARRGTAILVALAASPRFVVGVVRRQLLLAAVPPALLGAALGWFFGRGVTEAENSWLMLASLPIGLLAAGLIAAAGALVAARAVKPAILESSAPENLRAP